MIDDNEEQIVRTRAIRNEPCLGCRGRILRNDPMVKFWGVSLHSWCFETWRSSHAAELAQTHRELSWSVGCPECGAQPLQPCSEDGANREDSHQARLDLYSANKRKGIGPNDEKLQAWRMARGLSYSGPVQRRQWGDVTKPAKPQPPRGAWAMPYVP